MCMLVLGTHRSGTSITTALVQAQGFALGQPLLHVGDENPLGHFEHVHVLAMHEAFLAEVGLQWFDRVDPLALAGAERRQRWQAEIAEQYAGISEGAGRFAVKDPRLVHFLPLWLAALHAMEVDARALVTLRHPGSTARSLQVRNGLAVEHAEQIWLRDMAALQRGIGELRHGVVRYESLVADPINVMREGLSQAGVEWDSAAEATMRGLVNPALNRSGVGAEGDAPAAGRLHATIETLPSVRDWPPIG